MYEIKQFKIARASAEGRNGGRLIFPIHPAGSSRGEVEKRTFSCCTAAWGQPRLTFAVKRHVIQNRGGWIRASSRHYPSTDPLACVKHENDPALWDDHGFATCSVTHCPRWPVTRILVNTAISRAVLLFQIFR